MLTSIEASKEKVDSTGLYHRVHLSEREKGELRPGVFLVHGRAGNATLMWPFTKALVDFKLRPVVIAPQAFIADPIGGYSWWEVSSSALDPATGFRKTQRSDLLSGLEKLENFILRAVEIYDIDPRQVYAFGFSQGAALVATLSLCRPQLFQGVALLAGFIPSVVFSPPALVYEGVLGKSEKLPKYFFAHGSKDEVIPLSLAQTAKERLEELGAEVEFSIDEVGHKVGSGGMKGLSKWMSLVRSKT